MAAMTCLLLLEQYHRINRPWLVWKSRRDERIKAWKIGLKDPR
jgi:hypothetical protein